MKPNERQNLSHVEVTDENGEQKSLVIKEDMEKALFLHHNKHFSQTDGTPFTSDKFV